MMKLDARRLTRKDVTERIEKGGPDMKKILKIAIPVTIAVVIAVLLLVFLLPRPVWLLQRGRTIHGRCYYRIQLPGGERNTREQEIPLARGRRSRGKACGIDKRRALSHRIPARRGQRAHDKYLRRGRRKNARIVLRGRRRRHKFDALDEHRRHVRRRCLYGGRDAAEKLIDDILALVQPYEE